MSVDRNLLVEFIKSTNDNNNKPKKEILYGTIVNQNGKDFVKIDGSDIVTPMRSTTGVKTDERVTVEIRNHMAIVTGNLTDPAVGCDRIDGIDGKNEHYDHLFAGNITADNIAAGSITADKILAGSITADKILADQIDANHIKADSIDAKHIKANAITADKIEAGAITADKIEAGAITSDKILAGTIIAGSGIISNGAIGSAQISNLEASKLTAGTIDTSDITIAGANGNLRLRGNRLQVFNGIGASQVERVSIGDVNADGTVYGLRVRGADGKTILLDENGVTEQGITNGSITNDKINPNAGISGGKLDIDSVIDTINADGSKTINSVRIDVDSKQLSAVIQEINDKSTELDSNIKTNTASIQANKDSINLKVDEQEYISDMAGVNTTLSKHTADINIVKEGISLSATKTEVANQIKASEDATKEYVNTSITSYDASLDVKFDGINMSVSEVIGTIDGLEDTVDTMKGSIAAIDIKADGISQSVTNLEGAVAAVDIKADGISQSVTGLEGAVAAVDIKADGISQNVSNIQGDITSLNVKVDGISQKVTNVEGAVAAVDIKADGISQKVTGLDGKYTELKHTVDGIDITGKVSFSDLSSPGRTIINGGNITTGSISGDMIRGGTITATDEINFRGGARIFGNSGSYGAGLEISAQTYLLNSGDVNIQQVLYAATGRSGSGTVLKAKHSSYDIHSTEAAFEVLGNGEGHFNRYNVRGSNGNWYSAFKVSSNGNCSVGNEIWAFKYGTIYSALNANIEIYNSTNKWDIIDDFYAVETSNGLLLQNKSLQQKNVVQSALNPCIENVDDDDIIKMDSLLAVLIECVKELKVENAILKEKLGV